ncbi:hypothetical protein EP073_04170 [Geovibrio thiophilus]|uniref:Uncharacterized protein n=1 Tax=Geovibrio thiophilus TaxID=139438 RepID=A0A410JX89_9BACT|nr:hypothetical protein [Geovibrio thiophilus]QAR32631.1 hypothetical protein EP073_04170 [Geovibrio thiophilus]
MSAGISCTTAALIVLLGINEFSRMLNILMRPYSGLSSAVLALLAAGFAGFILFFKNSGKQTLKGVSMLLSVVSVFCIARYYMMVARPALDTHILTLLLITSAVFGAWLQMSINADLDFRTDLAVKTGLGLVSLCGILLAVFVVRMAFLTAEDRILSAGKLLTGDYSFLFWASAALLFLVPFIMFIISLIKKKPAMPLLSGVSFAAGVFLLCVLINQMPVVKDSINNRIIF